ncbi:MAG: GDP-mannose mannosyl hydrolase [Luteimonas sp.]
MLSKDVFLTVVTNAPLVSIDLLVRDPAGRLLVGLRTNPPAQGLWFAPGGRIRKDETLDDAFRRITEVELGRSFQRSDAGPPVLHEHFYAEDFSGGDAGTHYVVLAHVLNVDPDALDLPEDQHSGYRWVDAAEGLADPQIHANTLAYFKG